MILLDNIIWEKTKEFMKNLNIMEDIIGFSNRWLGSFKFWNNLSKQQIYGEANSISLSILPELWVKLQKLIFKYDSSDVFNCNKTGLFYCMTPNQTLASKPVFETKKASYLFFIY